MNSQDINNHSNNRADAVEKLIAFCTEQGLSYRYTEKRFTIPLPGYEHLPTAVSQPKAPKRKTFNTDAWGPKGYVEGEEPDPEQPLTEGEPPEGQIV